jgi:hypothetical protein
VKKARQKLRERNFWHSWQDKGGKGYIAHYQPNPAVLTRQAPELAMAGDLADETVASTTSMIPQGIGEEHWQDLLLSEKSPPSLEYQSIGSVADVPPNRPQRTGNSVGDVPPEPK